MHLDCTFEACEVCREIENLDEEIRKLSEKRTALKNSRNTFHDRLSTKLPIKIICKIFVLVDKANNHSSDRRPPVMAKVYFCAPVILSGVCRRWREIAYSLPELWTNVYLNLRRQPDQITEDWLNRSNALPLNLTLYFEDDESGDECMLEVDPICDILRKHSARWQRLDLRYTPGHISYSLFDKLQTMPQSDSFELLLGDIVILSTRKTISLDPPFRPVRYHSRSTYSLRIVPCEWDNLTYLELDYYEIEDILGFIRVAPKLKRCILRNMRDLSNFKIAAPVEHKVLEDLDVTYNEGPSVAKFFRNITLPSLRHLKYDLKPFYTGYHHHLDFDGLNAFFVRSQLSSTSLRTFSLEYHDPLSFDPINFLELARVTHLSFDLCHHGFDSNILKSFLLEISGDLSVLPRLQDLRFQLGNCPDILTNHRRYQAALSNFIAKHNSQLKLAKDQLKQGLSSRSTVDDVPLRHKNAQDLDLTTNDGTPPYRPLRFISIEVEKSYESDESEVVYIAQRNSESDAALQERWFLNQA